MCIKVPPAPAALMFVGFWIILFKHQKTIAIGLIFTELSFRSGAPVKLKGVHLLYEASQMERVVEDTPYITYNTRQRIIMIYHLDVLGMRSR